MDQQNKCSICEEYLGGNGLGLTKVQTTGLTTSILKSKARDDDKHKLSTGESCILVNKSCRKRYSALSSTKKHTSKNGANVPATSSQTSKTPDQGPAGQPSQPVSTIRFAFDYSNKYVLCGQDLDGTHTSVRNLTNEDKGTLIKIITDANREDQRIIIDRLSNTPTLGSIQPSVHMTCDREFSAIKPRPENQNNGKVAKNGEEAKNHDSQECAFTEICNYIEKSGEFELQSSTLEK
ncbi:hypothetical protein QAD02_020391 [Eretmocerus hayati]|uniref:Uncharacterized protein n=1 Tax=Eretmocerus hayati TaxID=131215 RepID=A0ACC2PMS2_9HYME|nr:hypothetical protein QAD02_020391 [Eretmocerus hayati]